MNKIFMLFLIIFTSFFLANAANSQTNNSMNQMVGNSLEKMSYIEVLANQSTKFKPYCWYDQSSLDGCFRASSVMLIGYDENQNILAYLQQGQVEDSGITYRLKVQNLGTNKILMNQKFYYDVNSKLFEEKSVELNQISYFYKKNETEIKKLLGGFNIQPSVYSFQYTPYIKNNSLVTIGFSETQGLATFGFEAPIKVPVLKNLVLKKTR